MSIDIPLEQASLAHLQHTPILACQKAKSGRAEQTAANGSVITLPSVRTLVREACTKA